MIALIPGSFDPITLGHVDIVERTAKKFDKVYVAVMNNDSSKHDKTLSSKSYMFDMDTRLAFVRLSTEHLKNVEVISSSGMLIDLFDDVCADVIVKGIRNEEDLNYELIHAKWNKEHNPRVETLFLPASENLCDVSSTIVRKMISEKNYDGLSSVLSEKALKFLKNK